MIENSVKQWAAPVERFEAALKALDGKFVACGRDELKDQILNLLQEKGVNEIMSWVPNHLPEGLVEGLQNQGISMDFKGNPSIKVGANGRASGDCGNWDAGPGFRPGPTGVDILAAGGPYCYPSRKRYLRESPAGA